MGIIWKSKFPRVIFWLLSLIWSFWAVTDHSYWRNFESHSPNPQMWRTMAISQCHFKYFSNCCTTLLSSAFRTCLSGNLTPTAFLRTVAKRQWILKLMERKHQQSIVSIMKNYLLPHLRVLKLGSISYIPCRDKM